jgi:hypothetical protein
MSVRRGKIKIAGGEILPSFHLLSLEIIILQHLAVFIHTDFIAVLYCRLLITVVARSKARNIFTRSNTGIMDSNLTQGMDVCLCLFCVLGSGLVTD